MATNVEDFSTWDAEALIRVPPETLEYVDIIELIKELQSRYSELLWMYEGLRK